MPGDVVVRASGLGKCYQIYERPSDRLRQMVWRGRQFFREFWALRDVSFEIRRGETVGIIGRNGSGKSTLLQMICGVLNPTTGSIETRGRIASMLELGAGFNPEFTGRENVYLSASLHGLTREQTDERFDRIAAFADIGEFIEQPVKTYSSGMFVRLAFAVIAHVDADMLVIDEALAVGDAFFVQKCMRFLRQFAQTGTMIFVSHDVGAVLNLCGSAIWLQDGRMRAMGSPRDLTNEYLQALYEERQTERVEAPGATPAQSSAPQPASQGSPEASEAPAQPVTSAAGGGGSTPPVVPSALAAVPGRPLPRDMRAAFINTTRLRNDIEVFAFRPDASGFGATGARVVDVRFEDDRGQPLAWIVGGEDVAVTVECRSEHELFSPIVGFIVKDRLGQVLFGDNTFLSTLERPLRVDAGRRLTARFAFTMPRLPNGDYAVSAAIAEGTQAEHVQHHWMHDALTFKVHSTSVFTGLIGIPMTRIDLAAQD
jgi:lipopolysaccharide transport system ATP-binding protein